MLKTTSAALTSLTRKGVENFVYFTLFYPPNFCILLYFSILNFALATHIFVFFFFFNNKATYFFHTSDILQL